MSEPTYLHELADERASDASASTLDEPQVAALDTESNLFEVYGGLAAPEPEPKAPSERIVEGVHAVLDGVVIPAGAALATRLPHRRGGLRRASARASDARTGRRPRWAVVAVSAGLVALAASAVVALFPGGARREPQQASAQAQGGRDAGTVTVARGLAERDRARQAAGSARQARAGRHRGRRRPSRRPSRGPARHRRSRRHRAGGHSSGHQRVSQPASASPATPAPEPQSTPVAPAPAAPAPAPAQSGPSAEFGLEP